MIPEDRRKQILELIERSGYLSVGELARRLYISEPTVRRDLIVLENEGSLKRTHGGASHLIDGQLAWPFDLRRKVNLEEKTLIGKLATSLLHDGDQIFIDSGSTTYCFARQLDPSLRLNVLTTCVPIAQSLAQNQSMRVEVPCGFYDSHDATIYGEEVATFIERRCAKYLFVSTGGFSAKFGFTGTDKTGITAKRSFHKHAQKTVLLMDRTKIGHTGYFLVFDWNEVDILITDMPLCGEELQRCKEHKIQLICGDGAPEA